MKGKDFIFDCVHLLYYQCHKINFKRGGSYLDSPDSIKNKKRKTTNPTRITNDMQRITKNKPFKINIMRGEETIYQKRMI